MLRYTGPVQGASGEDSVSMVTAEFIEVEFPCSAAEGRCPPILRRSAAKALLAGLFAFGLLFIRIAAFGSVQVAEGRNSAETVEAPSPQQSGGDSKPAAVAQAEALHTDKKKKHFPPRGAIVAAPLPIVSPAIGTGIVPVLGYIFPLDKNDKVSPPSIIGGAGLITDDGSRGFGLYGDLYLKEDRYEVTSLYGHGNIDYNL
jgi:hypothetical protein